MEQCLRSEVSVLIGSAGLIESINMPMLTASCWRIRHDHAFHSAEGKQIQLKSLQHTEVWYPEVYRIGKGLRKHPGKTDLPILDLYDNLDHNGALFFLSDFSGTSDFIRDEGDSCYDNTEERLLTFSTL
ncbi:hypothetical protein NCC49_002476 [Naganishia albida]|nr:hypothetical protein NCC49_002476 [Naganishia albida]